MWAMIIVFGAVVWLIAALIQAALLQASFKIVTKDTPPFGGTYKLCLVATTSDRPRQPRAHANRDRTGPVTDSGNLY